MSDLALTKEDVWGVFDMDTMTRTSTGMIVASSMEGYPHTCPVWGDELPYKSVTVICTPEQEAGVQRWLSYVHGGWYSKRKVLEDGRVALRSDYQCW